MEEPAAAEDDSQQKDDTDKPEDVTDVEKPAEKVADDEPRTEDIQELKTEDTDDKVRTEDETVEDQPKDLGTQKEDEPAAPEHDSQLKDDTEDVTDLEKPAEKENAEEEVRTDVAQLRTEEPRDLQTEEGDLDVVVEEPKPGEDSSEEEKFEDATPATEIETAEPTDERNEMSDQDDQEAPESGYFGSLTTDPSVENVQIFHPSEKPETLVVHLDSTTTDADVKEAIEKTEPDKETKDGEIVPTEELSSPTEVTESERERAETKTTDDVTETATERDAEDIEIAALDAEVLEMKDLVKAESDEWEGSEVGGKKTPEKTEVPEAEERSFEDAEPSFVDAETDRPEAPEASVAGNDAAATTDDSAVAVTDVTDEDATKPSGKIETGATAEEVKYGVTPQDSLHEETDQESDEHFEEAIDVDSTDTREQELAEVEPKEEEMAVGVKYEKTDAYAQDVKQMPDGSTVVYEEKYEGIAKVFGSEEDTLVMVAEQEQQRVEDEDKLPAAETASDELEFTKEPEGAKSDETKVKEAREKEEDADDFDETFKDAEEIQEEKTAEEAREDNKEETPDEMDKETKQEPEDMPAPTDEEKDASTLTPGEDSADLTVILPEPTDTLQDTQQQERPRDEETELPSPVLEGTSVDRDVSPGQQHIDAESEEAAAKEEEPTAPEDTRGGELKETDVPQTSGEESTPEDVQVQEPPRDDEGKEEMAPSSEPTEDETQKETDRGYRTVTLETETDEFEKMYEPKKTGVEEGEELSKPLDEEPLVGQESSEDETFHETDRGYKTVTVKSETDEFSSAYEPKERVMQEGEELEKPSEESVEEASPEDKTFEQTDRGFATVTVESETDELSSFEQKMVDTQEGEQLKQPSGELSQIQESTEDEALKETDRGFKTVTVETETDEFSTMYEPKGTGLEEGEQLSQPQEDKFEEAEGYIEDANKETDKKQEGPEEQEEQSVDRGYEVLEPEGEDLKGEEEKFEDVAAAVEEPEQDEQAKEHEGETPEEGIPADESEGMREEDLKDEKFEDVAVTAVDEPEQDKQAKDHEGEEGILDESEGMREEDLKDEDVTAVEEPEQGEEAKEHEEKGIADEPEDIQGQDEFKPAEQEQMEPDSLEEEVPEVEEEQAEEPERKDDEHPDQTLETSSTDEGDQFEEFEDSLQEEEKYPVEPHDKIATVEETSQKTEDETTEDREAEDSLETGRDEPVRTSSDEEDHFKDADDIQDGGILREVAPGTVELPSETVESFQEDLAAQYTESDRDEHKALVAEDEKTPDVDAGKGDVDIPETGIPESSSDDAEEGKVLDENDAKDQMPTELDLSKDSVESLGEEFRDTETGKEDESGDAIPGKDTEKEQDQMPEEVDTSRDSAEEFRDTETGKEDEFRDAIPGEDTEKALEEASGERELDKEHADDQRPEELDMSKDSEEMSGEEFRETEVSKDEFKDAVPGEDTIEALERVFSEEDQVGKDAEDQIPGELDTSKDSADEFRDAVPGEDTEKAPEEVSGEKELEKHAEDQTPEETKGTEGEGVPEDEFRDTETGKEEVSGERELELHAEDQMADETKDTERKGEPEDEFRDTETGKEVEFKDVPGTEEAPEGVSSEGEQGNEATEDQTLGEAETFKGSEEEFRDTETSKEEFKEGEETERVSEKEEEDQEDAKDQMPGEAETSEEIAEDELRDTEASKEDEFRDVIPAEETEAEEGKKDAKDQMPGEVEKDSDTAAEFTDAEPSKRDEFKDVIPAEVTEGVSEEQERKTDAEDQMPEEVDKDLSKDSEDSAAEFTDAEPSKEDEFKDVIPGEEIEGVSEQAEEDRKDVKDQMAEEMDVSKDSEEGSADEFRDAVPAKDTESEEVAGEKEPDTTDTTEDNTQEATVTDESGIGEEAKEADDVPRQDLDEPEDSRTEPSAPPLAEVEPEEKATMLDLSATDIEEV